MRISVVIPAFNEEATLGACLESIVNQDVPAHEVIVVDNGSIDGTAKVAGDFGAKIISETRPGIVHARNAGFNAATGDVIARIDADTRAPRDWIRRIRDHFVSNDCDALAGIGRPYDALLLQTTLYMRLFFAFMRMLQGGKEVLLGFNMAISRAFWRKVRDELCTNEEWIHEDIDLSIHIHQAGGRILRDN
ncbi:MAG: glycosyltransferase family A protein, partial [Patescibacteria group bacterium]